MFWLYVLAVCSRTCLENSLDVRSCFLWVCSLFFGFFVDAVLFFLKRHSSGSNRTPPHALVLLFLVRFFCPAALVCSAHFGRASCFLAFFSGCHSGPRVFLGFSLNLLGLSSLAPFASPFLGTRGGKGVSWLLFLGLCFPLLFCSAASHVLLEAQPMARPTAGPGRSTSRPSPEWGPGGASLRAEGCSPPVLGYRCLFCLAEGRRDPRTHSVQGLFVGEGGFSSAPSGPFSHALVFFPAPGFFCLFLWLTLGAPTGLSDAIAR